MRLPVRKSQQLRRRDDEGPIPLTPEGILRLEDDLKRLESVERPRAVEDVSVAVAKGDLSENAEYQEAKSRLARIDGRIFSITDRLKRAVTIEKGASDRVELGSSVTVVADGKRKTYLIVGPSESNPSHGRISHVSPLGSALIGNSVGDVVTVSTERGDVEYRIEGIG